MNAAQADGDKGPGFCPDLVDGLESGGIHDRYVVQLGGSLLDDSSHGQAEGIRARFSVGQCPLSSLKRGRQRGRVLAVGFAEINVAAAASQAVGLADGGATDHLDVQLEVTAQAT